MPEIEEKTIFENNLALAGFLRQKSTKKSFFENNLTPAGFMRQKSTKKSFFENTQFDQAFEYVL